MDQCNPCAYKFDYISKLETISDDGEYLMGKANFPKEYLKLRRDTKYYQIYTKFLIVWILFRPL